MICEMSEVFTPVRAWPSSEQPRERLFRQGPAALSDAELVAVLLRTGRRGETVVDLARALLAATGGLHGLAHLPPTALERQPGIGPGKAATLVAALELGRRTWSASAPTTRLDAPEAVWRYVRARFLGERREVLWVLGLDVRNRPIVEAIVGAGTVDRAPAHPREIFGPLLTAGAARGILVHNHPSGDPTPSGADQRLTERMVAAGELVGIPIVDHVIVGGGEAWVSLRQHTPHLF